jgi:LCP family protein required for cell wall assembly
LDISEPAATGKGHSPSLAAALSLIWPGLGQMYAGRRRLAALLFAPTLPLAAILAYQLRQGPDVFIARFVDPEFCLWALAIVGLMAAWRIAAVVQPFLSEGRRLRPANRPMLDRLVAAVLVAAVVVTHGLGGLVLATAYQSTSSIFDGSPGLLGDELATPTPSALASLTPSPGPSPTASPSPSPIPPATPKPADGRVTMVFTGLDSATTRSTGSFDALMVVSYDPKKNAIQMVNIPREIASFPFYFGGKDRASDWITYLPRYLQSGHTTGSPDSPYMTLVKEIQYLVGVHIDYWCAIDLNGFVKVIDALGGVDVVSPYVILDKTYDWLDRVDFGVFIAKGPQHLNGAYALAFARSRHGGGNDYKRAARQQLIMRALLAKMSAPGAIFSLTGVIATVGASVKTGSTNPAKPFRPTMVADYLAAAEGVPSKNFTDVVLGPPYTKSIPRVLANGKSSICMSMPMVAAESIRLFGADSIWFGQPTPPNTCP